MAELEYEELERHIAEICAGKKIVYIQNKEGVEVPILFRHASFKDKQLATFIYRRAMVEAEQQELPTLVQMTSLIKERGLFSVADQDKLKKLESKLEGQKAILAKTTRVPARRDRIKEVISGIEDEINELKLKKEKLLEFTRERKSNEEMMMYLAWAGSLDPFTERLYWDSYENFKKEKDYLFLRRVFIEYAIYHYGIEQSTIRAIARSTMWKIRFVNAIKTSESLFGRAILDYTTDQLMLCYWSNFYQSISEMMPDERPPDSVVEDDAALDAYMKDWSAERNRDDTAARSKKNKYGAPSAWDYNETLVMKSNEVFQDVDYSKTLKEKGAANGGTSVDAAPMGRGKKGRG